MRILFITHGLNLSGAARHMTSLAMGLREYYDCEVHVATRQTHSGEPMGIDFYQKCGMHVHQVEMPAYGFNRKNYECLKSSVKKISEIHREFPIDLIHVHAPTLCVLANRFAKRHALNYVTTFNIMTDGSRKRKVARWANRLLHKPFGRSVFSISSEMTEQLVNDFLIPKGTVRQIVYTVDERQFGLISSQRRRQMREKFGLRSDQSVACCLARIESRKNHELVIHAVHDARKRGRSIVVLCAGADAGGLEEMTRLAKQLEVDDLVRFLGFVDSKEVMAASDISILTSHNEGFPLAIVEAMHMGLVPIRTPSSGAYDQIKDGITGFIVPFARPDVLADRLIALFDNPSDLADMKLRSARYAAEQLGLRRMIDQVYEAYKDAVEIRH